MTALVHMVEIDQQITEESLKLAKLEQEFREKEKQIKTNLTLLRGRLSALISIASQTDSN